MRAAFIDAVGPADGIRVGQVDEPRPGPTDVLVDVVCTTVNLVDTFIRSGAYAVPMTFPFVVGRDLVGRVVAAAGGFAPGELVWCNSLGHGGRQGAAAERVVVPAERLYRLPSGVSPADAVTVLHPAATASLALVEHGRVRAGETVLIGGAAGNVGSALVVMAVEAGARVVGTAHPRDFEYCRGLGVDAVVDYREKNLPGEVDLYVDTSGTNDLETAVGLLAERGRIVLVAGMATRPVLPAGALFLKSATVTGFVISRATVAELDSAARTVNRLLATGRLRSRYTDSLPLSETSAAHLRLERGESGGRRVVIDLALQVDSM